MTKTQNVLDQIATVQKLETILQTETNKLKNMVVSTEVKHETPKVSPVSNEKRGPGQRIPSDLKETIKQMFQLGKTGVEIKKALNVSLPTVYKVKEDMGLVKHRSLNW